MLLFVPAYLIHPTNKPFRPMKISKSSIEEIKTFRADYLNSLPEFQELFLEIMMDASNFYLLQSDDTPVGYAIANHEGVLIEFYVCDKYLSISSALFNLVLNALSVKEVYCKTFDALLLSNCMLNHMSYSVYGVLYRDYLEPVIQKDPEMEMKKSGLDALPLFQSQDDSIKEL